MAPSFAIIVAVDDDFGIGKGGFLPWDLPGEIRHFKDVTTADYNGLENVVVMGRKTWESLPVKFRPLPKRLNVVVTRQRDYQIPSGVLRAESLQNALQLLSDRPFGKIFVIGGAELFRAAINLPSCREIYLTRIQSSFGCDCFFPSLPQDFNEAFRSQTYQEKNIAYSVHFYNR